MVESVRQIDHRGAGRQSSPSRARLDVVDVNAVSAECRGVLGVGLRLVIVDAEVVLDGGEPVDDPTILFRPLGFITLADQVPHERPHPILQLDAGIAGAEEALGAAGGLDGLDPGDGGRSIGSAPLRVLSRPR